MARVGEITVPVRAVPVPQWPSPGRIVHIDVGGFAHTPAIILDEYDPMDQPVEQIRVQAFPVNEHPSPIYAGPGTWHFPEYVGPAKP